MLRDFIRLRFLLKCGSSRRHRYYYDILGLTGDTKIYTLEDIESAFIKSITQFEEGRLTSTNYVKRIEENSGAPSGVELSVSERAEVLAICKSYLVLRRPITRRIYDLTGLRGIQFLEKPSGVIHYAVDKYGMQSTVIILSLFVLLVSSYASLLFCLGIFIFADRCWNILERKTRDGRSSVEITHTSVGPRCIFLINGVLDLTDSCNSAASPLLRPYLPMLDVSVESLARNWNANILQFASTCMLVVAHLALCFQLDFTQEREWTFVLLPWVIFEVIKSVLLVWETHDIQIFGGSQLYRLFDGHTASQTPVMASAGEVLSLAQRTTVLFIAIATV